MSVIYKRNMHSPNVSTTPITAMGCRQCLPLSVVRLKGKHCRNPHCRNGVVDTFGHYCLVHVVDRAKSVNNYLLSKNVEAAI